MKKILYAISLAAAAFVCAACNDKVLSDVDCYVTLDPENTYRVGEEVRFNINGNSDFIYFFSGEVGSQYEYRERTTIDLEDLETCTLVIEYQARYGYAGALGVYASKTFQGLEGDNAMADLATMQVLQGAMDADGNIPGWERLPYAEGASTVTTTQEYDITDYADNFCLAFHWDTKDHTVTQRTYWINIYLKTKFRGYDEVTLRGTDMGLTSICMNTDYISDPYYRDNGNGTVRFTGGYDIIMQGVGADVLPYALDSWVVTKPQPLNRIAPDKGYSVKAMADDISQFSYTYSKPGTYKCSFVITNANYQGSNRKVQDITVNVIEPIEPAE